MTTYQRERAPDLWGEIMPLLHEHKDEIAHYSDIALDPDITSYEFAEEAGTLRCYTARAHGVLVGYAVFFVRYNMHYAESLQAVQDVLFVTKPHRHGRPDQPIPGDAIRRESRELPLDPRGASAAGS